MERTERVTKAGGRGEPPRDGRQGHVVLSLICSGLSFLCSHIKSSVVVHKRQGVIIISGHCDGRIGAASDRDVTHLIRGPRSPTCSGLPAAALQMATCFSVVFSFPNSPHSVGGFKHNLSSFL